MDTLAAAFAGSFQVSQAPNTTAAQHPRYSLYKSQGNYMQNNRRQKLLEIQKQRRFDTLAHSRRLANDNWKGMKEEEEESYMEVSVRKPGRYYKNQLMMSEWLVEVPEDFEEEWLMVLCPVAKRRLVVASHGNTVVYNKAGYRTSSFPSLLPGGNHHQPGKYNDYTILDCLLDESTGTYWILDLMCWKSMPIYETETEFRFYWLHQNLQENPDLGIKRRENPYCFQALPSFPCTPTAIEEALDNSTFEIDGLIFFHKRTHYTFGSTPLVVWLKPYMIEDVLNISVPPRYMVQMPETYMGYAHHIAQVKADRYGNEHRRPRKSEEDDDKSTAIYEEKRACVVKLCEQKLNEMGQSNEGASSIQMGQDDTHSSSSQSRSSDAALQPSASIMDTCISEESISHNQAQIKLLIQPTKFKFGKLKMSDKINPFGIGFDQMSVRPKSPSMAEGDTNTVSRKVTNKDKVLVTEDSMSVEPIQAEKSTIVITKFGATSPNENEVKNKN